MSSKEQLRKELQNEIQTLPETLLEDVKLFIDFLRMHEPADEEGYPINIDLALQQLKSVDITHLEEEITDSRLLYPHED